MKAYVLFSGGKDSSLTAIMLEKFFEVELVTCSFGIIPTAEISKDLAKIIGFPHRVINPGTDILEKACDMAIQDSFLNNAINFLHRQSLLKIVSDRDSDDVFLIADGIRRDDRVPNLTKSEIQSFEDKNNILYASPLSGFGRKTINEMVRLNLIIEEGESSVLQKCDYEEELREMLNRKIGVEDANTLFPKSHKQSRVVKRIYDL